MPQVHRSHPELHSVMAELVRRRRREVVAVVASDVGTDAAALAPPFVTVGSQTGESKKKTSITFHYISTSCMAGRIVAFYFFFFFLPGLNVLRHDAPR